MLNINASCSAALCLYVLGWKWPTKLILPHSTLSLPQNDLPNLRSSPCWGVLIQHRRHPRVYPWAAHWEHPWPRCLPECHRVKAPVTPVFRLWDALAIFMVNVRSSRASKGFRKAASLKETTSWNSWNRAEPEDDERKQVWRLTNITKIECILPHKCYAISREHASIFLLFTQDIQVEIRCYVVNLAFAKALPNTKHRPQDCVVFHKWSLGANS